MALRILALLLCALAAPAPAQGLRHVGDAVRAELRPGWREADGRHVAGLSLDLAPGWKTYWRAPGRIGIAPRLDWRASRNVRSVAPLWPSPRPIVQAGGRSIGYDGDVVLPLVVEPVDPSAPVRLRGTLDIGVCATVCVPARLTVDAVLPPRGAPDPAIRAALADRPGAAGRTTCALVPHAGGLALRVEMAAPPLGAPEAVAVEAPGADLTVGEAAVVRRGGTLVATVPVAGRAGAPVALDRARLRITAMGSDRAVEAAGCVGG